MIFRVGCIVICLTLEVEPQIWNRTQCFILWSKDFAVVHAFDEDEWQCSPTENG